MLVHWVDCPAVAEPYSAAQKGRHAVQLYITLHSLHAAARRWVQREQSILVVHATLLAVNTGRAVGQPQRVQQH